MSTPKNPVGWFEIYIQDMNRARAFYEQTLEMPLTKLPDTPLEMYAFPMFKDAPGATGALVKMEGKSSGGGGTLVYFPCEDCTVTAQRVVKYGGSIMKEKFAIGPYGFISLIVDTEGNVVGLHSMA